MAELMREFRPITEMLAQSAGYSYEDWAALDPSDFSVTVQGSYATSSSASVIALNGSHEIGSSTFALTNVGGTYTFSNPSEVKAWSEQFVDIADSIYVELIVADTGTITSSVNEGGETRASATFGSGSGEPSPPVIIE